MRVELSGKSYKVAQELANLLNVNPKLLHRIHQFSGDELYNIIRGNFSLEKFKIGQVVRRIVDLNQDIETKREGYTFTISEVGTGCVRCDRGYLHTLDEVERVSDEEAEIFLAWKDVEKGDILVYRDDRGKKYLVIFEERKDNYIVYKNIDEDMEYSAHADKFYVYGSKRKDEQHD